MRKLTLSALAFTAFAGLTSAANAAPFINITGASGTFGSNDVCGLSTCTFDETITFTTPTGFILASANVSNTPTSPQTNIDFEFASLNGVLFNPVLNSGTELLNIFNQALVQGATNTLRFRGRAGNDASYSGNISFAVPGPIAGAGLPVLMALGGLVWARRRKAAATA
jgi:hypothetical protein